MKIFNSLLFSLIGATLISGCAPALGSFLLAGSYIVSTNAVDRFEQNNSEPIAIDKSCTEARDFKRDSDEPAIICSFVTGCTPTPCQ